MNNKNLSKKYLNIYIENGYLLNIYNLYFTTKKDIIYNDNDSILYEYTLNKDNKKYNFIGCKKNEYFMIILDVYDTIYKNYIYNKNVLLIKLDWQVTNINNINIYTINILDKLKTKYIFICLRNEIENSYFTIDELLKITKYNTHKCILKYTSSNKNNFEKVTNIFNKLSLIN